MARKRSSSSRVYQLCATAISFISTIYITAVSDSWVFAGSICWAIVIWIVKYSILAFYWRLFSGNRRVVRFVIWALGVLVTCWGVAMVRFCPLIRL